MTFCSHGSFLEHLKELNTIKSIKLIGTYEKERTHHEQVNKLRIFVDFQNSRNV